MTKYETLEKNRLLYIVAAYKYIHLFYTNVLSLSRILSKWYEGIKRRTMIYRRVFLKFKS